MELKDIMAISGKPGLFKFVSQGKNGIIVESLMDGKRIPAFGSDKVSALDDISVYTEDGEERLSIIYDRIFEKENGGQSINPKSDQKDIMLYFSGILPEYDKERVYFSDVKKLFSWYNLLQEKGLLIQSTPENNAEADDEKSGDVLENDTDNKE
jgi:hypothetical protein